MQINRGLSPDIARILPKERSRNGSLAENKRGLSPIIVVHAGGDFVAATVGVRDAVGGAGGVVPPVAGGLDDGGGGFVVDSTG